MARPFQFRLRTTILLTALAAVLCLAGAPTVEQYRKFVLQPTPVQWGPSDDFGCIE